MTEKNHLLIIHLKEVRKQRGYSYQYIVDGCERVGYSVSMSTVKRVFAEGSEEMGFRYSTLRPIAIVVLGLDEVTRNEAATPDEAGALRAIIAIKDKQIEDLHHTLSEKTAEVVRLTKIIDRLLDS